MQVEAKCKVCEKKFKKQIEEESSRNLSQDICYDCALESITRGQPPEEGDFNTAMIQSGEMSDDERKILQDDLRSVDWAACQPDPEDEPNDDPWYDDER